MKKICLVAVDIRSTYNVGAFFRTCDGFGADLILVGITPRPASNNDSRLPHISAKADSAISKTALGAEKTVSWRYFKDTESAINYLKSKNYKLVAIEQAPNSKNMKDLIIDEPTALFMGPEVTGFNKDELMMFDDILEIPMVGNKESFNVSVAAGIALYQATS